MDGETPEFEHTANEMGRHLFDAVNQIQELKELRTDAFAKAEVHMHEIARMLKGREQLPRSVLKQLHMAAGILENEAPYAKDKAATVAMTNAVRTTLGFIIWGQCHDDYTPGAPRIK